MVGWLRPNETGHTHSHTTRTNVQPTNEHTNEQNGQRRNDRFTVEDAVAAPKMVVVRLETRRRSLGDHEQALVSLKNKRNRRRGGMVYKNRCN